MGKCPKCGKRLSHLRHAQSGITYYECWLKDGEMQYQHDEFEPDGGVNEWYCPECEETLFLSEAEAMAFLGKEKKR